MRNSIQTTATAYKNGFQNREYEDRPWVGAVTIGYFAETKGHGGIATYSRELLRHLEDSVDHVRPPTLLRPWAANKLLCNNIALRRMDDEVIHITHQGDLSFLGPVPDRTLVVTVHDIFPYLEGHSGPVSTWMAERYVRRLEDDADQVIAISEATEEQLLEHTDVPADRITVIYQGIDTDTYHRTQETDEHLYLHVGSGLDRKNIDGLIEIFAGIHEQDPDARLVRVGGFTEDQRTRIREAGLEDAIGTVSDITTEELVDLYSAARCLLFPSTGEGFGRPMLEALACGTPVIAFDRKPMAEVLPDAMLVDDQEAFVRAALDPPGADCRAIASGYSWEETAERTMDVYRTVQ